MEEQASWYSKHWPTLAGLLLTTVALFLTLFHQGHPTTDLVPVAAFFLITGLLWFCLLVAITRYVVFARQARKIRVECLAAQSSHESQIDDLNANLRAANERAAVRAVEVCEQFNRDMEEHNFFTPLQWDVFRLVRELRTFAKEVGPFPYPKNDPEIAERGEAGIRDYILRASRVGNPYLDRVRFGYEDRFLERVQKARTKLAEKSLHDDWLTNVVTSVRDDAAIKEIAERLFTLATKLSV